MTEIIQPPKILVYFREISPDCHFVEVESFHATEGKRVKKILKIEGITEKISAKWTSGESRRRGR